MEVDTQTGGADDSVQVVLIGSTGSGKSCTGNSILDNKHFPSDTSVKSVTLKCKSVTETIHGRRVTVVDTPGWDCTELPKRVVEAGVQEALKNLRGPYSFLLVIRIGGVESEDINKISGLQKVLGPSFLDHTTILFSHRDNLGQKTFRQFLQERGAQFQDLLKSCGRRCHSWNNRDRRSDEEVEKVLRDLKTTEMKDQHQARSSEEQVHRNRAEQKANCGNRSRETDTAAVDAQNSRKPVRVLFLGMSKTGKTSSIKTLLAKCERTEDEGVYSYSPAGLLLQLIDSRGFDQNLKEIQELISKSEPHVIVMVMEVGRFSPAVKTMQDLEDFLGPNATKHTMILFTRKDDLDGAPIERFIEEIAELKIIVELNGRRFHALNNRDPSDRRQVEELLQKIANVFEVNEGRSYKPVDKCSDQRPEKGADPWRIVLLGKTGVGKSATGNTILGERVFRTESRATSVTPCCSKVTREVHGRTITIINTPGLYDTNMSNDFIVNETVNMIKMAAPGPHALLLVIDVRRFTEVEKNTVRKFQQIFGEGVNNHMIVLFTRGDDLEFDNKTIETYIKEAGPGLRHLISSCGGRYHVFNNRNRNDHTQVKELFQKVHNMLWLNNYVYYSYELFTIAKFLKDARESKGAKDRRIAELEKNVRDQQNKNDSMCCLL